jgi:polar amino acid transport system permease protein
MLTFFSGHFLWDSLPSLIDGLRVTVEVSAIGIAGGLAGGVLLAVCRAAGGRLTRAVIASYVGFVRNTPFVGHLFFLYFGLPSAGVILSGYQVAWISLIAWGAAYSAENFRAGIEAVPANIIEGAEALGLRRPTVFLRVVLPIAFRIALPAAGNTAVGVLKNSSYTMLIAVPELTYRAINIVNDSYRVWEMFVALGVSYLLLVAALGGGIALLEKRLAVAERT